MNNLKLMDTFSNPMNQSYPVQNVSISSEEFTFFKNAVLALFLVFLDLLTIVGNSFVVLAIIFDLHLRSPTHYLMGSLALADLLIGAVVLPFSSFQLYFGSWPFGNVFCTIWKSKFYFTNCICIFDDKVLALF